MSQLYTVVNRLPSHPPAYALRGLAHSRYFGTSLRFFGTDVPNSQHNLTKLICLFHVYRRRFQMNMRTFSTLRIELMFIPRLCHLTDGLAVSYYHGFAGS